MNSCFLLAVIFINAALISCADFDVTTYGADKAGAKKSTDAIKKAIEAAVAKGGGTVVFPKGTYLTGPINLRSKVTLHLEDGTNIKWSTDRADYPKITVKAPSGKQELPITPFIYAYGETDIGITGKGTLDGQGSVLFHEKNVTRPNFIQINECTGITLTDITVKNSPMMNINPVYCDDIKITGVTISNPEDSHNTDGINCKSCRNLQITKVTINTGDDCIAINSHDLGGAKRPTENVHISDSHMGVCHAGVAFGSAVSGGVHNVTVSNCVFDGSYKGIYVKTNRERGGTVENVVVTGITMNVKDEGICLAMVYNGTTQAALHDPNVKKEAVTATTPVIRNIEFKDIKGSAKTAIWLIGVPESPIEDITITNVNITSKEKQGLINTKNVTINGKKES